MGVVVVVKKGGTEITYSESLLVTGGWTLKGVGCRLLGGTVMVAGGGFAMLGGGYPTEPVTGATPGGIQKMQQSWVAYEFVFGGLATTALGAWAISGCPD